MIRNIERALLQLQRAETNDELADAVILVQQLQTEMLRVSRKWGCYGEAGAPLSRKFSRVLPK